MALNGESAECQITDTVQQLVTNAFVGPSQAIVPCSVGTADQQIGIGEMFSIAEPLQRFDLGFQHKRAGCRDFAQMIYDTGIGGVKKKVAPKKKAPAKAKAKARAKPRAKKK